MSETFKAKAYTDYVGRPRKLSAGAILAITREFAAGASTRDLAERYGVSRSLIGTVCWHTKKESSK